MSNDKFLEGGYADFTVEGETVDIIAAPEVLEVSETIQEGSGIRDAEPEIGEDTAFMTQDFDDAIGDEDLEIAEDDSFFDEGDNDFDESESDEVIEEFRDVSDAISDLPQWLGDINPNYDPYDYTSPYCNNCGSCAYAVYRRLQGDPDICATATNIPYNSEMEALTGMTQVSMSPSEIERRLLAQGDGAHAIIGIDRAEGPGHWFNAACIDGRVVAIDGQTGEITEWPPDYGNVVNWEMSIDLNKENL